MRRFKCSCYWGSALLVIFTACSLPLVGAYLATEGPAWLVQHIAQCHARGVASGLDLTFLFGALR